MSAGQPVRGATSTASVALAQSCCDGFQCKAAEITEEMLCGDESIVNAKNTKDDGRDARPTGSSSPRTQPSSSSAQATIVIPAHAGIHSLSLHSLSLYDIVLKTGNHFLFFPLDSHFRGNDGGVWIPFPSLSSPHSKDDGRDARPTGSSSPRTQPSSSSAQAGIHSLSLRSLSLYDIVLKTGNHFLFFPLLSRWIPTFVGMTITRRLRTQDSGPRTQDSGLKAHRRMGFTRATHTAWRFRFVSTHATNIQRCVRHIHSAAVRGVVWQRVNTHR